MRAAKYLRSLGYRIVASSYRTKEGEVDLIGWDGEILVFIEVKSRMNSDAPEAAVRAAKRRRIIRAAHAYIARYKLHDKTYRFDIVAVNETPGKSATCRLLRDAFRLEDTASFRL